MHWSASQALAQIICGKPLKLEDGEWSSEMGSRIAAAQQNLSKYISQGKIRAYGRKFSHEALDQIPPNIFRNPKIELVISPHGDVEAAQPHHRYRYEGQSWCSIEFDQNEVALLYPSAPRLDVDAWMDKAAKEYQAKGQIGKRQAMVGDCRKETGCTKREAEAAHARLPQKYRRGRGKQPMARG
jgi:hypothetical protein